MKIENAQLGEQVKAKSEELGISEEIVTLALYIIHQNKELVNAMDNRTEMDEYIYRAVIKSSTERRKQAATLGLESDDDEVRSQSEKDLSVLSREELTTDPYYRAILPVIAKVVAHEAILRLHADEAADIVLKLADFKRRFRATSVTEIIIKQCRAELSEFTDTSVILSEDIHAYTFI